MKMKKIMYMLIVIGLSLKSVVALEETQKYEDYLNKLKTLSGEFTQVNNNGQMLTGTIQMSRPGKLRLTYDPPSSLLIVADGKWLITKDADGSVDYSSLDKTPAAFILRPHVHFSGDVQVTNVVPNESSTAVTLIRKEEPDTGYITLVFNDDPISLKEWSVLDAQGIETRVILSKIQSNVNLPHELFFIESPNLLQQIF